jgi:hypothetical protein
MAAQPSTTSVPSLGSFYPRPPPPASSSPAAANHSNGAASKRPNYLVDVDDEVSAKMPPIEATTKESPPATTTSRRKQSKPHRVETSSGTAESEDITKKVAPVAATVKDAIETESDSDDCLVIAEEPSPKEEPAPPPTRVMTPIKKRKVISIDGGENKAAAAEEPKAKKQAVTTPKGEPKKPPASKKSSTAKPLKKRRSSTGKFDQVENELEAMFAGLEEDTKQSTSNPSPSKQVIEEPAQSPVTVEKEQTDPKTPTPGKKKAGEKSNETSNSGKKRGRPTKAEILLRQSIEGQSPGGKTTPGKTPVKTPSLKKTPKKERLKQQSAAATEELFPGPFVRVAEDKESSCVVNGPPESFINRNKSVVNEIDHRRRVDALGGPTCTIDPVYNAKQQDDSWLCVFCHKGSHVEEMGDLFGPYFVSSSALPQQHPAVTAALANSPIKQEAAAKFIVDAQKKKKKRKLSGSSRDAAIEVWFHEDCVCWMPDLRLLGSKLYGLEEAIAGAAGAMCSVCGKCGATVACVAAKGCKQMAHFPCCTKEWTIDAEEFQAFCEKH